MKRESESSSPDPTKSKRPSMTTSSHTHADTAIYSRAYVIDNYSKLTEDVGKHVYSPPFGIGDFQFKLIVYPGGDTMALKGFTSLYLELCKPSKAEITYRLAVLDHNGIEKFDMIKSTSPFEANSAKSAYGLKKFASTSNLVGNLMPLTNDRLIILCEIFNLDASDSLYEIQKLRSYKDYLNNELYSDVKIIVQGKTIHAHRIILTSGNEIITAMLQMATKDSKDAIINMENTDYEVMFELVRFVYTGQIHNIERLAKKLIIAANKCGITQLKIKCEDYLCQLLSMIDVLELLDFADSHSLSKLKNAAITFFVTHKKDIVKTKDFKKKIETLKPTLVADLMILASS